MKSTNLNYPPISYGNKSDPRWAAVLSGGDAVRSRQSPPRIGILGAFKERIR